MGERDGALPLPSLATSTHPPLPARLLDGQALDVFMLLRKERGLHKEGLFAAEAKAGTVKTRDVMQMLWQSLVPCPSLPLPRTFAYLSTSPPALWPEKIQRPFTHRSRASGHHRHTVL